MKISSRPIPTSQRTLDGHARYSKRIRRIRALYPGPSDQYIRSIASNIDNNLVITDSIALAAINVVHRLEKREKATKTEETKKTETKFESK